MDPTLCILFCENPLQPGVPDPDFTAESVAAAASGYNLLLFSYEALTGTSPAEATREIQPAAGPVPLIYRGWMLTPQQYTLLYVALKAKNYFLVNTPQQYRHCHYLPDSLERIKDLTPATVFEKLEDENSISRLIGKAAVFGDRPVVVKDFVKSEKHDWARACFVPRASDTAALRQVIDTLLQLRGKYLNEGLVIREFMDLSPLTLHTKSGMPLTEEYRLFFLQKQLLGIYNYWEEGGYRPGLPDTTIFEAIAQKIDSNFFTMDIARKTDGAFIIMELGDGQVAGLPEATDIPLFYHTLKKYLVTAT
ncbi:ATP-grasp domain-containing protein [Taibaiella chishuiensis]|uniref:ATP-grasp domain-containing protein n=1 Tax=Taibaiella chishuiensis TaxID=1434707 RepID=A0A2P8D0F0_9BACT|nr:ATP-grasp domain-containing protein [Taibaiella chishuiensis]PSK90695.1 hypothetical protein B0I18_107105 [Taibaiella chishuiensis]